MAEAVTKRLHVSGLTPAITKEDLQKRLGSFGSVKALDGYGTRDGLGDPKKFAYVTLETTQGQLSKCLNILSGTIWKGTKLRIGEAKPDYRERLKREHEDAEEDANNPKRVKRLPRGLHGVHAPDLTPITPDTANSHPAWRTTVLGRLVRPVRMRPTHPLPLPPSTLKSKSKGNGENGAKRKRRKDPPTRARRVTIDPTKWEPEHLKGNLLGGTVVVDALSRRTPPKSPSKPSVAVPDVDETSDSSGEENDSKDEHVQMANFIPPPPSNSRLLPPSPATTKPSSKASAKTSQPSLTSRPDLTLSADGISLAAENAAHLSLLNSLFGDKDEAWNDAASLDSDLEAEEAARLVKEKTEAAQDEGDEEDDSESSSSGEDSEGTPDEEEEEDEAKQPDARPTSTETAIPPNFKQVIAPAQATLKDLFAPREEMTFSLLGHLNLDLELDDELDFSAPLPVHAPAASTTQHIHTPSVVSQPAFRPAPSGPITIDPTIPFFFPISMHSTAHRFPNNDTGQNENQPPKYTYPPVYPKGKRPKYAHELALESARTWRQSFFREETEAQAREWWEGVKGELTVEWKRRHREAVKSRRRRGGGVGDGE